MKLENVGGMNSPNDPDETKFQRDDDAVDAEIAEILDEYLAGRDRAARDGEKPIDRETFLANHPQHADRLAELLDGVDLFDDGETLGLVGATPADLPDSIGDFDILSELGRGGMGVVYEAREKSLDRIVALKVMRFGIVDPKALERFQREAETAGALHHTNIVPVYATGREGDTSWYAMQRIDGQSLAQRIDQANHDKQLIDVDEIVDLGIQAAEALAHAHRRDVIHRDVKPANLIIDDQQRVWLTDFGLARRLVDVGATMTGAILGTPRFMSPEQADVRTTDVDARSDIYSLGATLYEMATGKPPFDADDPLKMITQIRYEEPAEPRTIRSNLPRDLEIVLLKCMEKQADRRYQNADALADDLRAIADDRPIRARAVSSFEKSIRWLRKHSGRVRVAGLTMIATALLIAVSLFAWNAYHESTLGAFRLRAGGGPHRTTIYPAGESSLSSRAIELTVPMQTHQKLVAGDYDLMLSPPGRWSRKLRLSVASGLPTEQRLTGRMTETKEVVLADTFTTTIGGDEPAILSRRDGTITRTTLSGSHDWEIDASEIESAIYRLLLPSSAESKSDKTETVDFAATPRSPNFDRGNRSLDDQPFFTDGQLALDVSIDLNADGRPDTLIAATDRSALLAIDTDGKVIWARSYQIRDAPTSPDIPTPYGSIDKLPTPGVRQLIEIGDIDDDGTADVLAVLMHVRLTPPTDVCIAVISGADGRPIRTMVPPAIQTKTGMWPADGLLFFSKHQYRGIHGLGFNEHGAYRNSGFRNDFEIRAQPRSTPLRLPLPSEIRIAETQDGQRLVVYLAGDLFSRFDLETGEPVDNAIKLPFMPAIAPKIIHDDQTQALLFCDIKSSWRPNGTQGTRMVAYSLLGEALWERHLKFIEFRDSIGRNLPDWPLVADLNSDGRQEIIVPRSKYLNGVDIGVVALSASDGQSIWDRDLPMQLVRSADDTLAKIAVTTDIDGDGWNDIVTASIAGEAVELRGGIASTQVGSAYVYVDWISGKTGAPLCWARHPISIVSDKIALADVDAIRTGLSGVDPATVELDFVTGDGTIDTELNSMVLRFHPSSPDPVSIASGLDVIPTSKSSDSNVRVYRRRAGPYLNGEDRLVLMRDDQPPTLRLGENELVTTWVDSNDRSLVAVKGFEPPQLSVLDADNLQTIWTTSRMETGYYRWRPIFKGDGSVDFLQQNARQNAASVSYLDGITGQVRWSASEPIGGRLIAANLSKDENRILVIGDGQEWGHAVDPVDSFKMTMFDTRTGISLWSTYFLFKAPRYNYPSNFDDMRLVDVNEDGVEDVVGPLRTEDSEELQLAVWDGRSGDLLWQRSIRKNAANRNYFAVFEIIQSEDQKCIVFVAPDVDEPNETNFYCWGAATGETLATHRIDWRSFPSYLRRQREFQYLALADCSSKASPSIAIQIIGGSRYEFKVLSLVENDLKETHSEITRDGSIWRQAVWLRDVNGDGKPERLVLYRPERNPNDSTIHMKCHTLDDNKSIWDFTFPFAGNIQRAVWQNGSESSMIWLTFNDGKYVGVDCTIGEILHTFTSKNILETNLPQAVASTTSTGQPTIAIPTNDGMQFRRSFSRNKSADPVSIHLTHDPRRIRPLISHAETPGAFRSFLVKHARGGFTVGVLFMMPLFYLIASFRRRQWSISWLMIAPIIVALWTVCWRTDWIRQPGLLENIVYGVTPWAVAGVLTLAWRQRDTSFPKGNVRLMLIFGTVVVFGLMFAWERLRPLDPMSQYTVAFSDLVFLALISLGVICNIYWVIRIPIECLLFIGRSVRWLFRIGRTSSRPSAGAAP